MSKISIYLISSLIFSLYGIMASKRIFLILGIIFLIIALAKYLSQKIN